MSEKRLVSHIRKIKQLEAEIKELEKQADLLKEQVKREMENQGAEVLQAGGFIVRWTHVSSNRLDTKALKESHPRIYKRFIKEQESRRFSVA